MLIDASLKLDKAVLSAFAIGLTLFAFVPYIRAILGDKVKPHVFSWVIWGSTTFIVFLAQLADGAGVGAWSIGVSGIITLAVAALAYTKKSDSQIVAIDWLFFVTAMSSLPFWYVTADPFWAVIILTTVDLAGFAPTLRKAYVFPQEEQLTFFILMALRNVVAIAALEHFSLTTVLFPAATAAACVILIAVVVQRRQLTTE